MTLPKRKVTAQIAEHRSCWSTVCAAENLNTEKSAYTCETSARRPSIWAQIPDQVLRVLEYSWCNPEKSSHGEEKGPAMLHAPGPILVATAP
jgi:hypothetical protein